MADATVNPRRFYVYVLFRHDTAEPFYVGKGMGRRIEAHERLAKVDTNRHKAHIIKLAQAAGARVPAVKVREHLTEAEAFETERALIAAIGRTCHGGPLVNMSDGGEGQTGYVPTQETIEKIAAKTRGQKRGPMSEEQKLAISIRNTGRKRTPEQIEALRLITTGRKHTDAAKAAIGDAHRGKKMSEAACAKIGAKSKGRVCSEATRAKLSAAGKARELDPNYVHPMLGKPAHNRGVSPTEEARRKAGEANKGRKHTEATKAKVSKALRERGSPSEESRQKSSDTQKGRKRSEEDKLKMRLGWAKRNAAKAAANSEAIESTKNAQQLDLFGRPIK